MFQKNKNFFYSSIFSVLTLSTLLLYPNSFHHALSGSPSRTIAQNLEEITRNRVMEPERLIEDVHVKSVFEKVVKLQRARIVIADYDLIRRDFPHVKNLSNPQIDEWIIDQVGYVSLPQAAQTVVNTKIPVSDIYRQAARPPEYGRALVFPVADPKNSIAQIGLIDVKGSGGLNPGEEDHGNGVATLGECVREYLYENLVRDVLDDADLPNKTVGSYAVIDAGFGVIHADGSSSPAGLYLRQAHHRVTNSGAWLSPKIREDLQNVFHRYGIDPFYNVQGTTSSDIFDFGHYVVKDDLPTTIPEKQIPFNLWGYDKSIKADPEDRWFYSKKDYPWKWSHELSEAFANGKASRDDAWAHFENLMKPARAKLTLFRVKDYALDGYSASRDVANFLKRMNFEKNVFILNNIKVNLLNKNKMDDSLWHNFDVLVQLTKSLDILPVDGDTARLHQMIIDKAVEEMNVIKQPLPEEIGNLVSKLSAQERARINMLVAGIKHGDASCAGIALDIIQH